MRNTVMVLCCHEPEKDPRIKLEADELKTIYNTIVVGITHDKKSKDKITDNYKEYLLSVNGDQWRRQILQLFEIQNKYIKSNILRLINNIIRFSYQTGVYKLFFKIIPKYHIFNHLLYELSYSIPLSNNSIIDANKPNIAHCNDIYTLLAGIILKTKYGCKLVYDSHELYPESIPLAPFYMKYYLRSVERELIQYADGIFTVTQQIAAIMKRDYGLKKIVILPNVEKWSDYKKICFESNKIIFLYQGGYLPGRGLEELIEQWKYIDHSKAVLYMRGPGSSFLNRLKETAREQVVEGSIIFLDSVQEDEQVARMKGADVGIIPYLPNSLNNKYSCPNKFSQYMHAGLAILSNNLDFIKDIVQREKLGLIYDSKKIYLLSQCINLFIEDRSKLNIYKKNSYNYGKQRFNWDILKEVYLDTIKSIN